MANKPAIAMEMDMEEGYAALGHIEGIAKAIETDRYIGSVIKYTHSVLAKVFDEEMDVRALGNYTAYSHVYEPRMLGMPNGRLWKHKVGGSGTIKGAGRVREATFQFRASARPILTPEERASDPNDPMSEVPWKIINKLSKRKYIFYSRASMMEYGLRATVRPRWSKRLFVPTMGPEGGPGHYYLPLSTKQSFGYANPQDESGGPGTVGKFTAAWVEWWATEAPRLWDAQVKHTIENDLGKSEAELKKTVRSRPKTKKVVGLAVFKGTSEHAAFESGRNLAEAYVFGKAQSYSAAARYVDENGVYG